MRFIIKTLSLYQQASFKKEISRVPFYQAKEVVVYHWVPGPPLPYAIRKTPPEPAKPCVFSPLNFPVAKDLLTITRKKTKIFIKNRLNYMQPPCTVCSYRNTSRSNVRRSKFEVRCWMPDIRCLQPQTFNFKLQTPNLQLPTSNNSSLICHNPVIRALPRLRENSILHSL